MKQKQTIKLNESQLRHMIIKALNEKLCLTEDILIGKGGGYYGGSPIFRVCVDNGNGTEYLFSPPGWDFDTQSQLEAAAICCHSNKSFLSELLNSPELNQLPVSMPSDNDKIEALYWLTGGNAEWNHGYWAEHGCKWNDETIKLLMGDSDIIGMLDNAVSSSNSFAELVSHLREGEYMVYANDILPLQYDDEEGTQEQLQESKLRAIIKESIKKVLNEGQEEIQNRAVEALSSIGIEVANKTPYEILKELKEMYGLDCHVHPDRDGEMCYWWITDKTGEVLVEGDDTPYGNSSERFIWEMILEMCKLILKK